MRAFAAPYRPDEPPLPAWSRPKPGEPAHGFVVRMAALNDRSSVRTMLIAHGLNGRYINPAECLDFAHSLPFQGREALAHATPVVSPEGVTLMGQTLRRRQWQIERRRFCPACLAEDAYHRAWWDILAFGRCPHHDIDIVDRDANDRWVPWWSPSFTRTPSGHELTRHGIKRRARPTPSLEAYILGRLGVGEAVRLPLLDDLPSLGEALDAVRLLGRIAIWGATRPPPASAGDGGADREVARAGYAVAARGEAGVLDLLRGIAEARTGVRAGHHKLSCFGWVPEAIKADDGAPHGIMMHNVMDRVMVERGSIVRGGVVPSVAEAMALRDLAGELGVAVATLKRVSQALGIHGSAAEMRRNRYLSFGPEEAGLVRHTFRTSVDRRGAAELLGVPRRTVCALVGAGLLRPFVGIGGGRTATRFRPEDVQALAASLVSSAKAVSDVPDGYRRFGAIGPTRWFDPAAFVARALRADGEAPIRAGSRACDLLVRLPARAAQAGGTDAMAKARAARLPQPGLGRCEAATLLGISCHRRRRP